MSSHRTEHSTSMPRIGVIGAGMAGLAAACSLVARGLEVVVLDKGRGPGGRTSSRRAEPYAFDHGAQYFTARDPRFRAELDGWLRAGVVQRWDGKIVSLHDEGAEPVSEGTERYVGTPRMSALARHLARGVEVRCNTRVAAAERVDGGWSLFDPEGARLDTFDQLLVTTPPEQATELIGESSPLERQAAGITMRPCWAVLLGIGTPFPVEFDGAFCDSEVLSWVARDSSKPGRPASETWVLHATSEWSEAHLDADRPAVTARLVTELERLAGRTLPEVRHRDAHLWRYARPHEDAAVQADSILVDGERGLALAGDAYCGGRMEGAYLSGLEAARRLG